MQKFYLSDADATIQKLQNQLKEAQITIEEKNTMVDSLQSDIHVQQTRINELNDTIESQHSDIVSQQVQIGELNATIDSQRSTIQSQQSEISSQLSQIQELTATIDSQTSTINSQQSEISSQQSQIQELNATINSQLVIISSQRSQIEQLQSLLSEQPVITYVDYPLCMSYYSIHLVNQADWLKLTLCHQYDSGSHFWWLVCGTSQIQFQYDKMWLINKNTQAYFTLATIVDVNVSHAGTEVSDEHSKLLRSNRYFYTACYTDTPYLFIPIGIVNALIRVLKVNASGDTQTLYLQSRSELDSKTFPMFL